MGLSLRRFGLCNVNSDCKLSLGTCHTFTSAHFFVAGTDHALSDTPFQDLAFLNCTSIEWTICKLFMTNLKRAILTVKSFLHLVEALKLMTRPQGELNYGKCKQQQRENERKQCSESFRLSFRNIVQRSSGSFLDFVDSSRRSWAAHSQAVTATGTRRLSLMDGMLNARFLLTGLPKPCFEKSEKLFSRLKYFCALLFRKFTFFHLPPRESSFWQHFRAAFQSAYTNFAP